MKSPHSTAMVALATDARLSVAKIERDLMSTWPDLPPPDLTHERDSGLSFQLGDAEIILAVTPGPIPWSELEGPTVIKRFRRDAAKELKRHTRHLVVTVRGDLTPFVHSSILTQVTAAVLGTCKTVGVYWVSAGLVVSPESFREFAVKSLPKAPPVPLWIDVRVRPKFFGGSSGFTVGLSAFGLMELECLHSPELPGELRERFVGLAGYLLQGGSAIRDGDAVGQNADECIRVIHSDSSFGRLNPVMRLLYQNNRGPLQYLTRITHGGCNILGLLECLSAVAGMMAAIEIDWPARWLGKGVLVATFLFVGVFDFAWRYRQTEPASRWRFVSPFAGGCIGFLPLWLLFTIMWLTIALLAKR
jgi:hypothetical protein